MIQLAGGLDPLIEYTRSFVNAEMTSDLQLAAHYADWVFAARPDDPGVQQLVIDVYRARIMDPATNTQELLTYLDQMTAARTRQLGN